MVRIPTHRTPTHPGEMLIEEFLKPMGLTQRELSDAIHVQCQRIADFRLLRESPEEESEIRRRFPELAKFV
jgi:plasmid maintenance system antidote protein VapI